MTEETPESPKNEVSTILHPSGNKDPRPDEIDPVGIDYGIFKGESNG